MQKDTRCRNTVPITIMKKTPIDGHCPRCGAELERKDELRFGNEGWIDDGTKDREKADGIKKNFLQDCPNCEYIYP